MKTLYGLSWMVLAFILGAAIENGGHQDTVTEVGFGIYFALLVIRIVAFIGIEVGKRKADNE
jgi:hypothetical protein